MTKIQEFESDYAQVEFSVLQGYVLRPLLFVYYIKSVTGAMGECNFLLYADHIAIYIWDS